jgi:hypothetical protein
MKKKVTTATKISTFKRNNLNIPFDEKRKKRDLNKNVSLNLSMFSKLNQNEREILLLKKIGDLPVRNEQFAGFYNSFLDIINSLYFNSIEIISILPGSGSYNDKMEIVAILGRYPVEECQVFFSSNTKEIQTNIINSSQEGALTKLYITVPDFPGASGPLSCHICIKHLLWYTVSPHDINTPYFHFSVIDSVSNSVPFSWQPSGPVIDAFEANYKSGTVQVEPGTNIHLFWRVRNVNYINIIRGGIIGPIPYVTEVYPSVQGLVENMKDIGTFEGDTPRQELYILTASNPWGSLFVSITVQLRKIPCIRLVGAEVIQTLQHFTLESTFTLPSGEIISSADYNNSIELVEKKRTMLRVYIDSGMVGGFQNNAGPDEQPNVTGTVTLTDSNGEVHICSNIRNISPRIISRPKSLINRADFEHTLNFELPWLTLSGQVRMKIRIWVDQDVDGKNHSSDIYYNGYMHEKDIGLFNFVPKKSLKIVCLRVKDNRLSLPEPSMNDYYKSVRGILARYPIAESGTEIRLPPLGNGVYETDLDLMKEEGWKNLLADINMLYISLLTGLSWDFNNDSYVFYSQSHWAAIVQNTGYNLNGIANISGACLIARAALPATYAHEMGHNIGFHHSGCGNNIKDVDSELPTHTEEVGLDVKSGVIAPQGIGDIMGYCDDQQRWPSLFVYSKLLKKFNT